ncbi:SUMF1/EgtB/PvdO family nonheme iron enzyme [Gimesia sp.]|uniref:SUMF1/EgtB/PvdO family nonheme iron enzyme n=1 Tax=Gimesia sp. TaxID=2024833 RepID=UPI003A959A0C
MTDDNPSQYPTRKPLREGAVESQLNSEFAEPGSDPTRGHQSQLPQSTSSDRDHWRFSEGDMIAERFTVTGKLGRGGMGEVYAVIDQLKNEPRALKVMRAAIDGAGSSRERFLNESRVDDLRHPHIVRTIDIGEWKERKLLYITMELVDGQSLRQLMGGPERLSVIDSLTICYQLCEALQFAHQHDIIHRDVKPDNVLVKREGQGLHAWLTDFGIARLQTSGMTKTVAGLGTPVYVAPEQLKSATQVTGQADLYSVGATLYELLTGQQPVGLFKLPSAYVNNLPEGIDELVSDALERLPEHRISDVGTMGARIGKILKDLNQDLKSVMTSQVNPASINLGDLVFEIQPRKAPQVTIEGVPGIPEEILELEGKRNQLQQTLDLIQAKTHPLVMEHQAGLQQLSERVNNLREQCQAKLPAGISSHEDGRLRELILAGKTGPAEMLKVVPEVDPEQLFQYVEILINALNAEQTLITTREKYKNQLQSETQRLKQELHETITQLELKRRQDLEKLIRSFFKTFRKQHPQDKSFPYSAWGKFQGDVLAKRRYQLTPFEMTLLAEQCFDSKSKSNHRIGADNDYFINTMIFRGTVVVGVLIIIVVFSLIYNSVPEAPVSPKAPVLFDNYQNSLIAPDGNKQFINSEEQVIEAQTNWAKHLGTDIEISNSIGMKFRLIPPGEFMMGSPESEASRDNDEVQHEVRITKPYYLGTTEVTQGQWKSMMGTTPWKGDSFVKEGDDYPATYMSWEDAQEFIKKLNASEGDLYRLPTEAEWEYACRAGSLSAYSFGDDAGELSGYAWFSDNADDIGEDYAHQVGQKRPNLFGLYDMHGNVWEWCEDWFGDYASDAVTDPTGPTTGSRRVDRGGSWFGDSGSCRSAHRDGSSPGYRLLLLGFRVLRSSVK